MRKVDIAVVGSGIGGSLISALNKDKDLILFEKDHNLGGCASTFKRFGHRFNTGATTFVGYEDNHLIKKMFDKIGLKPDIVQSDIAIRNIQGNKKVDRIQNFEMFLKQINENYYHPNNRVFWKRIKEIDEKFWSLKHLYFAKYSFKSFAKSAVFIAELLKEFNTDLFISAEGFIKSTLPNISKEYKAFIDSQLLITLQTTSKNATLLSMSLGLAYPFHKVFYANGGMGKLIEDILKDVEVKKNEEIISIEKNSNQYHLVTSKGEYLANKVILNSTIFDSSRLFLNDDIKSYFQQFKFGDQSAFVVYVKLNIKKEFVHHYQMVLEKNLPNCISNSFFISFSHEDDEVLSKNGLSLTISTHTKAVYWEGLSKDEYENKKLQTQEYIMDEFLKYFDDIKSENIMECFSATSKTFYRYINRSNCGGKPINIKSAFSLPSCKTPFEGLYNVGDTVSAGQGWPGVALGVDVLNKELNSK
jgi:phytoene dehydrogenase-like protein